MDVPNPSHTLAEANASKDSKGLPLLSGLPTHMRSSRTERRIVGATSKRFVPPSPIVCCRSWITSSGGFGICVTQPLAEQCHSLPHDLDAVVVHEVIHALGVELPEDGDINALEIRFYSIKFDGIASH